MLKIKKEVIYAEIVLFYPENILEEFSDTIINSMPLSMIKDYNIDSIFKKVNLVQFKMDGYGTPAIYINPDKIKGGYYKPSKEKYIVNRNPNSLFDSMTKEEYNKLKDDLEYKTTILTHGKAFANHRKNLMMKIEETVQFIE